MVCIVVSTCIYVFAAATGMLHGSVNCSLTLYHIHSLIGTLLLSCAQTESTDQLWLLSNDCFPFQNILSEGQSTLNIDGKVWALEEVPNIGR